MKLTTTKTDTDVTISIEGSIDTVTAPILEGEIKNATSSCGRLILDFTGVDYISSAGLRVLIATDQTIDTLILINVNEDVRDVFEMTGFDELITIN